MPDRLTPGAISDIRPWLFQLELVGIKLGLMQMQLLLERLHHPEHAFAAITVAGTNGKGSVSAMIERGLRASGQRTGRYTSPHLINVEERVVINGDPITAHAFDRAATLVRSAATALPSPPSFFEATTAVALVAFREAGVQVAVLEVGLGGRLDATNVVDAPLAVITNIGLDHQAYLGDTIEAIAAEKAGIIKPGARVVVGATRPDAARVIAETAARVGATRISAPDGVTLTSEVTRRDTRMTLETPSRDYGPLHLRLAGRHQVDNAVTAVRALEEAHRLGLAAIDVEAVQLALADAQWPGRLDWRQWHGHDVLVDGAHNPDGARALASYLADVVGRPVPFVFGMMRDKHVADVISILAPCAEKFVLTAAASPRAATPEELAAVAAVALPMTPVLVAESPEAALAMATARGGPVVVAGSLFLVGEVLAQCT